MGADAFRTGSVAASGDHDGPDGVSAYTRSLAVLLRRPEATLVAVLLVLALIVGFSNELFWSARNLTDVARSTSFMFVVAVGTTFVLISGGLDLSVGSVYGFSGVVAGLALVAGWPLALSILAGIGA